MNSVHVTIILCTMHWHNLYDDIRPRQGYWTVDWSIPFFHSLSDWPFNTWSLNNLFICKNTNSFCFQKRRDMTKCKPRLSLYKRKKYKQQIPATKRFQTPEKSHDKRARFVSPISASHSLKRQLNSPFRSSSLKKSPSSSTRKFRRIYSPVTSDQWQDIEVETLDADIDEDYKLFQTFKSELSKANIWENFSLFLNLVSANSFPLDNLSFLLFLDTVAFYSCKTTTQMVYLPQTKRFWKTGYRLFHAKFLYYMGGPIRT